MCEDSKTHTRVPARPLGSTLKDFATAIGKFTAKKFFHRLLLHPISYKHSQYLAHLRSRD